MWEELLVKALHPLIFVVLPFTSQSPKLCTFTLTHYTVSICHNTHMCVVDCNTNTVCTYMYVSKCNDKTMYTSEQFTAVCAHVTYISKQCAHTLCIPSPGSGRWTKCRGRANMEMRSWIEACRKCFVGTSQLQSQIKTKQNKKHINYYWVMGERGYYKVEKVYVGGLMEE